MLNLHELHAVSVYTGNCILQDENNIVSSIGWLGGGGSYANLPEHPLRASVISLLFENFTTSTTGRSRGCVRYFAHL